MAGWISKDNIDWVEYSSVGIFLYADVNPVQAPVYCSRGLIVKVRCPIRLLAN